MSPQLEAVLDHIAIAVPDAEAAERHWHDHFGGRVSGWGRTKEFDSRQLRLGGGGRLELLSPPAAATPDNFVRRYLDRFGCRIHHVTLKVPDLRTALAVVESAGYTAVDVRLEHPHWQELFLRPSEVGGLVVQVAWSPHTAQQWADLVGHVPEPVPSDAAVFRGARLRHPDLEAARRLWAVLGADVTGTRTGLRCSWPHSPLCLWVDEDAPAGPAALVMDGRGNMPAAEGLRPAVEELPVEG